MLSGLDPGLADNGGPTHTHALLAGSNAIGLAASCGLPEDQRGAARPAGECDSGAFEFVDCPDLVLSSEIVAGTDTRENCQAIVVGPDFSVANTGNLTLRAGKTIELGDTTSVESDGQLTLEIEPDLQLLPTVCPPGWSDCTASPGCETQNPSNDACIVATHLGTIYDWDGSGAIEVSVTSQIIVPGMSRWYRVHAADPPADDWKVLAKLFGISSGVNLDLHAYRRADGNTCTSTPPVPSGSCNENISGCGGNRENSNRCSQNSGNANECVSWTESCTVFLEDDESEVWVEVRHVSGGCGTFALKIRNNGNNDSLTCANF
jgi:hypothetical protein